MKMKKHKARFKLLLPLAVIVIAAVLGFTQFKNTPSAQAVTEDNSPLAPIAHIQYADDSGNASPTLPQECQVAANQLAFGLTTTDNNDPDCLRVKNANVLASYSRDFRFCLTYTPYGGGASSGRKCTPWASQGMSNWNIPYPGVYSWTDLIDGNHGGNLRGTMTAVVESRSLAEAGLGSTARFSNVQFGVALAYADGTLGCRVGSGINWAPANGTPSEWAFGAPYDNDPGCFAAAMKFDSNIPPDAEFVSSTIPGAMNSGQTYNNNYNIVMRNKGMVWAADKVVRPSTRCNEGVWDYTAQPTCTDFRILSSDRFRLERTDQASNTAVVRAKRLGVGEIDYVGGNYTFTGPDITIPANPSSPTVDNTIPFFVKQNFTSRQVTGQTCEFGFNSNNIPKLTWQRKLINLFIKTAQAIPPDGCTMTPYSYLVETYTYEPAGEDQTNSGIVPGESAIFTPVNITAPNQSATLNFEMVDLNNLAQSSTPYHNNGRFGTEATIPITVAGSFTLTCPNTVPVQVQYPATPAVAIPVSANVSTGFTSNISVAMTSLENPGPTASPNPITLTSPGYVDSMNVLTNGLTPNTTYHLIFTGTSGGSTATCETQLVLNEDVVRITNFQYQNFTGNVPAQSVNSSGPLKWRTENARTCYGSSVPTTGSPSPCIWDLPNAPTANPGQPEGTDPVGPLTAPAAGRTYTFRLDCSNYSSSDYKVVVVPIGALSPATAQLKCFDQNPPLNSQQPHTGICTIVRGGAGTLDWGSTAANSCHLWGNGWDIPSAAPAGQISTSNLNTVGDTIFHAVCTGPGGASTESQVTYRVVNPDPPTGWLLCKGANDVGYHVGPCNVVSGTTMSLQWDSNDADYCKIDNGTNLATTGTMTTAILNNPPTASKTYSLVCTGPGGNSPPDIAAANVINGPVVNLRCMGDSDTTPQEGPCTVTSGLAGALSWSAPTNATSCSITGPFQQNPTTRTVDPTTAGTLTTGRLSNPPADQVFTMTCTGPAGTTSDPVHFNVIGDFGLECNPLALDPLYQGTTGYFNLSTTDINGLNSPVVFTYTISPLLGKPIVTLTNNGQVPSAVTTAAVSASFSTNIGTFNITFTGTGGGRVHSCTRTINVRPPPVITADLKCQGSGHPGPPQDAPCNVTNGTSGTLTWTSAGASSCVIRGFDAEPDDGTPVSTSGTMNTGSLTSPPSSRTFTLTCTGTAGTASDPVSFNIQGATTPDFGLSCSPLTINPLKQGLTDYVNLSTTSQNGFNNKVRFSAAISPLRTTPPVISFTNNQQTPPATTVASIRTESNTSTGLYAITFTGTEMIGSIPGSITHTCQTLVNVTGSGFVSAPDAVSASNSQCTKIILDWNRPSSGPTPVGYRVYATDETDKFGAPKNWQQIGQVLDNGATKYSYEDKTPPSPKGENYYAVSSYGSTGPESSKTIAQPSPIVPQSCAQNLSASDKDIISVNGKDNKGITACSGSVNADYIDQAFGLIRSGDIITFKINICNSGNEDAIITRVEDTFVNLTKPAAGWSAQYIGYKGPEDIVVTEKDNGIMFDFSDDNKVIPKKTKAGDTESYGVGSIIFKAQVRAAGTASSGIYRFQNRSTIFERAGSTTDANTPLFLFTTGAGAPNLKEVAP